GGRSPPPSGTYREYASRAAIGRRLAAGPFSSLEPDRLLQQAPGQPGVSGEVVARGGTLPQAFIEAVLGLFALAVDPAAVDPREAREIRAHGASLEALLAHWIGECCYVREMEG